MREERHCQCFLVSEKAMLLLFFFFVVVVSNTTLNFCERVNQRESRTSNKQTILLIENKDPFNDARTNSDRGLHEAWHSGTQLSRS